MAQLQEPISAAMGVAWLAVAVLVTAAGVGLAVAVPRWWLLAGAAALASQAMILTAFGDAGAGTVVNALILLTALYGYGRRARAASAPSTGAGSPRSSTRRSPGSRWTSAGSGGPTPPARTP